MSSLWMFRDKEYTANPITIGEWDFLGKCLRGYLLDDLRYQEDGETRIQNMSLIQMRDYDESDIIAHFGRRDIRYKVIKSIFKGDNRIDNALITDFETDAGFNLFVREVLKESGIKFLTDKKEENEKNPTQSPSVESG